MLTHWQNSFDFSPEVFLLEPRLALPNPKWETYWKQSSISQSSSRYVKRREKQLKAVHGVREVTVFVVCKPLAHAPHSGFVCRWWTLRQSLYFAWCRALLCTQPYPSSALCEDLGVASRLWLPAGFRQTVNIKFTQVNSAFAGHHSSSVLARQKLELYSFGLFFFLLLLNLCSAAVCSRPCRCAVLQLHWKHWERFDHGLCRGASTLKGVDQLHSECECDKNELQFSRCVQRRLYWWLKCCLFHRAKTFNSELCATQAKTFHKKRLH